MMHENDISEIILNSAIEVHRTLGGPGLLESVYEEAIAWELIQAGLKIKRQLDVPIHYKGQILATPLRLDLLVSDLVSFRGSGSYLPPAHEPKVGDRHQLW